MKTDNLKVSVVITTFNRPDYLQESLASVLKQSYPIAEVIVVDDCSEKSYTEVLSQFSDPRINYQRLAVSSGANKARNTGIALATSDIVAFLDDDDIWFPNFIENHIEAYQKNADAVICGWTRIRTSQDIGLETNVAVINSDTEVNAASLKQGNCYAGTSGFSAKASLLKDINFDESLSNGQDWDLFVRIISTGYLFVNLPKSLFYYRFGDHDGIGYASLKLSLDAFDTRLKSAYKHRQWLGEKYFKKRVAEELLNHLPERQDKWSWLRKSVQLTDLSMTCKTVVSKAFRKTRSSRG